MLSSTSRPNIVPAPPHKNYFSKVGIVEPTRDWLHLHITFNLSSFFLLASTPCNCQEVAQNYSRTQGLNWDIHSRTRIHVRYYNTSFHEQCNRARHNTHQLNTLISYAKHYSNAPGSSDRNERAAPLLLWSAVSAAIGPSGFSLAKFVLANISKASFIIDFAPTILSILKLTTYWIKGRKANNYSKLHKHDTYHMEGRLRQCQLEVDKYFRFQNKFDTALTQILKHSFPTELVHPAELMSQLPQLQQALNDKNIRLLIDNPADIANLPSSFIVKSNTFHIFLHVPVSHGPQLTAYKYIPTPSMHNKQHNATLTTITHTNSIIAINDDKTTYLELKDLADCTEMQSTRFLCPNTPVLHHSDQNSCLFALFTSNIENTYLYCTLIEFKRNYFATELGPTKFYLYTNKPEEAHITCSTPTLLDISQPFVSNPSTKQLTTTFPLHFTTSIIIIPTHCHIQIFNLSLFPASTHKTDVILGVPAAEHEKARFFDLQEVNNPNPHKLDSPKPSVIQYLGLYTPHMIAGISLFVALILICCIISIPLFCVKKRNGRFIVKQPLRDLLLCIHSRSDASPMANPQHTPQPDNNSIQQSTAIEEIGRSNVSMTDNQHNQQPIDNQPNAPVANTSSAPETQTDALQLESEVRYPIISRHETSPGGGVSGL